VALDASDADYLLVPFSVATYGQVQGKRQRDRLNKAIGKQAN
jgi:hypothetical protein